jgi:uncharacterized protein (TIGR02466 family)
MIIIPIFPTVITQSNIGQYFVNQQVISDIQKHCYTNTGGNSYSKNQQILNLEEFLNLKQLILTEVHTHFDEILKASTDIKPYITTSWINFSTKGQQHHPHQHPNSIISGVFYLNVVDNDCIMFTKSSSNQIVVKPTEYNLFNSDSWSVPVSNGDLVLFPSNLFHFVPPVTHTSTRISLAFNVFITGKLGEESESTYLELK